MGFVLGSPGLVFTFPEVGEFGRRPGGGGCKVMRAKAGEGEGRCILLTKRGVVLFMFFVLSVLAVHLLDVVFLLLLLAALELDEVEVLRSL